MALLVCINSIVTIFDLDLEEEITYSIVAGNKGKDDDLSCDSALGKALLGKKQGEIVLVKAEEEYNVQILEIDNSNVVRRTGPTPSPQKGVLVRNLHKGYGTRAQDIYDDCCKKFGWDSTKRGLFAPQKPLYAAAATREGYSPLFLAHSIWTESKGGIFTNTITENTIEEKWNEIGYDFYHDNHTRVVFAKSKNCSWNYVFIGVYKPIGYREENLPNGTTRWIKIFERISDEYGSTYV